MGRLKCVRPPLGKGHSDPLIQLYKYVFLITLDSHTTVFKFTEFQFKFIPCPRFPPNLPLYSFFIFSPLLHLCPLFLFLYIPSPFPMFHDLLCTILQPWPPFVRLLYLQLLFYPQPLVLFPLHHPPFIFFFPLPSLTSSHTEKLQSSSSM